MRCPIDGAELMMTDRAGVEIDYCPTCRGVWLDRGELDKIIDRAYAAPEPSTQVPPAYGEWADASQPSAPQAATPQHGYPPQNVENVSQQPNYPPQNYPPQNAQQPASPANSIVPALGGLIAGIAASKMSGGQHGRYGHSGHKKNKKHKGWLDEMFDFD